MRSSSSWIAKSRAETIANGVKVQLTNNTVNVDLGVVCKAIDYTRLMFTQPRCRATCSNSPTNIVLFGGIPSSNGPALSGGGPTSTGQVLSSGNI